MRVGYLPQEPHLNPKKNVFENIMEGMKEKKDLLDEFNDVSAKFAEEMSDDEINDLLMRHVFFHHQIRCQLEHFYQGSEEHALRYQFHAPFFG